MAVESVVEFCSRFYFPFYFNSTADIDYTTNSIPILLLILLPYHFNRIITGMVPCPVLWLEHVREGSVG